MKKNGSKLHVLSIQAALGAVHDRNWCLVVIWGGIDGPVLRVANDMGTAYLTVIFQRGNRSTRRPDNIHKHSSVILSMHTSNPVTGVQNSCRRTPWTQPQGSSHQGKQRQHSWMIRPMPFFLTAGHWHRKCSAKGLWPQPLGKSRQEGPDQAT